jgi:hypothetical protein
MRHHGLSGTLGLTFSGCSWILFSIGYFVYDTSTVLENAKGVDRNSNSNDSRHDPLLHCWLGRGSIRMTADKTHYSTVGLGGPQFEWQQTWPITPLLAWEGLFNTNCDHVSVLNIRVKCWTSHVTGWAELLQSWTLCIINLFLMTYRLLHV